MRNTSELEAERSFLRERLGVVIEERKERCRALVEDHPDSRESILARCRAPLEKGPSIDGLPLGADASLLRFKREEEVLYWLEESVEEIDLTQFLWHGPALLLDEAEAGRWRGDVRGIVDGEAWELRLEAETLRFLWAQWMEHRRATVGKGR